MPRLSFSSRSLCSSGLRLTRGKLERLREWIALEGRRALRATSTPIPGHATAGPVLTLAPSERRSSDRETLNTGVSVRVIGGGKLGRPVRAVLRDASEDGLAVEVSQPIGRGARLSITVDPPPGAARSWFGRSPAPMEILAIARYCRQEAQGHVIGCSFGMEWADTLAGQMIPADLPRRRSA